MATPILIKKIRRDKDAVPRSMSINQHLKYHIQIRDYITRIYTSNILYEATKVCTKSIGSDFAYRVETTHLTF